MPQTGARAALPALIVAVAAGVAIGFAIPTRAQPPAASNPHIAAERPFLDGNAKAMAKMMAGMAVKPTGNIDKDFVDMMVPHHQGAIDMAALELRYGRNERLKALAQEIIVTQQQEIAAMRLAVGETLPASKPSPISPDSTTASAAQ